MFHFLIHELQTICFVWLLLYIFIFFFFSFLPFSYYLQADAQVIAHNRFERKTQCVLFLTETTSKTMKISVTFCHFSRGIFFRNSFNRQYHMYHLLNKKKKKRYTQLHLNYTQTCSFYLYMVVAHECKCMTVVKSCIFLLRVFGFIFIHSIMKLQNCAPERWK